MYILFIVNFFWVVNIVHSNVITARPQNETLKEPEKALPKKTWDASNMPNPQKCPECCGLDSPGWICDPDNELSQKDIGGFEGSISLLNAQLHTLANQSMCPCTECGGRNATFTVYVVKSLRNTNNLPPRDVISNFATELMTSHEIESSKTSTCKQHIVMAMDVDDNLIHISIGQSVNRSGLMTYADVQTLFSAFAAFSVNEHTYLLLDLTIKAVTKYTEKHPKVPQLAETNKQPGGAGLSQAAVIVLIILCIAAVILGVGVPVYCSARRKCCGNRDKPSRKNSMDTFGKQNDKQQDTPT